MAIRSPVRIGVPLLLALAAAGCAGENLFLGPVGGGEGGGITITITSPAENTEFVLGASAQLEASIVAPQGLQGITYAGRYPDQSAAYTSITDASFNGEAATSVVAILPPVLGQTEGSAYLVVEVLDVGGNQAADSVKVSITP